ncbi:hypothetical protein J7K24_00965 [bacterium]|nr:hypothetical protein [bacterium]
MKRILTPEITKRIISTEAMVRGWDLKWLVEFIVKEKGQKGLEEVRKRMEELGYPLPEKYLKKVEFSPLGLRILIIAVAKEVFGWDTDKLQEWGKSIPKRLMIMKIFSRLFGINKKFLFYDLPKISSRYLKGLRIIPVKADIGQKYVIVRSDRPDIRGVPEEIEKIGLAFYKGFIIGWAQMVLGSEKVKCKVYRKDKYYEFVIQWD